MEYEADETMSFITIKNVLYNRYQIDTQSAGLFFRNQLKAYDTEGGNRNKMVLVVSKRVECISSTLFIVLPESVRAYFINTYGCKVRPPHTRFYLVFGL